MKTLLILLVSMCLSTMVQATAAKDYMDRFAAFTAWSDNLPTTPDEEFITFINGSAPLSNKLRERWLYQLAHNKNWSVFTQYYKPSEDINLQCYSHLANYYQGNTEAALNGAKSLWLIGESSPIACNNLFELLITSENFDERLLTQRIALALDKRNVSLARYLLKRYKKPRLMDHQILAMIQQNPAQVVQITPGELHDHFYLYGLKRLVSVNMNLALKIWDRPETKKMLPLPLQQSFIGHVVLYKAMRDDDDADIWFAKVKPAFYTDVLLEWKIRLAMKRQQWQVVEKLINHYQDKENLCWQYWLARAKEETGNKEEAHGIYQTLAANRHYYGFLASMRLHKNFSFQNESIAANKRILKSWQPFTDNIRQLYNSKQILQASRLLNDFLLELPLEDKSALITWVDNELQWHAKSLYLSSNKELNNQLNLRFPLPFGGSILAYSKNYQIPMELIYAIIRQESGFREDVVSSAGARGLMQVMPDTAKVVAKENKIAFNDKNQLFLSQKNINIGVAYLGHLGKRFSKNFILMAAAYNAGPRQVNYWLKNHSPKDADIWIETLPWRETRNYLKNVISFYAVYQYRMQHKSDLNSVMQSL